MSEPVKAAGMTCQAGVCVLVGDSHAVRKKMAARAVEDSQSNDWIVKYRNLTDEIEGSVQALQCKRRPGDEVLEIALASHRRMLLVQTIWEFGDTATLACVLHKWRTLLSTAPGKQRKQVLLLSCLEGLADSYLLDCLTRCIGVEIFCMVESRSEAPRMPPDTKARVLDRMADFFSWRARAVCIIGPQKPREVYFSGEKVEVSYIRMFGSDAEDLQVLHRSWSSRRCGHEYKILGKHQMFNELLVARNDLRPSPPGIQDVLKMVLDTGMAGLSEHSESSMKQILHDLLSPRTFSGAVDMLKVVCNSTSVAAVALEIMSQASQNTDKIEVYASLCECFGIFVSPLLDLCKEALSNKADVSGNVAEWKDRVFASAHLISELHLRQLVDAGTLQGCFDDAISHAKGAAPTSEVFAECACIMAELTLCSSGLIVARFSTGLCLLLEQKLLPQIRSQILNTVLGGLKASREWIEIWWPHLCRLTDAVGKHIYDEDRRLLSSPYKRASQNRRALDRVVSKLLSGFSHVCRSPSLWAERHTSALPEVFPSRPRCKMAGFSEARQVLQHIRNKLGLRKVDLRQPSGSLRKALLGWALRDEEYFVLPLYGGENMWLCQVNKGTYLVRSEDPLIVYTCFDEVALPDGTILDVEIVDNSIIHVADALGVGGLRLWHQPYAKRRSALESLAGLEDCRVPCDASCPSMFRLCLKPTFKASQVHLWVPGIFKEAVVAPSSTWSWKQGDRVFHAGVEGGPKAMGMISESQQSSEDADFVSVRWERKPGLPRRTHVGDLRLICTPEESSDRAAILVPNIWYMFGKDVLSYKWPCTGILHEDLLRSMLSAPDAASECDAEQIQEKRRHPAATYEFDKFQALVTDLVERGQVAQWHDDRTGLDIYNYRQDFAGPTASAEIRMCRGLVMHAELQHVVTLPFVRFFEEGVTVQDTCAESHVEVVHGVKKTQAFAKNEEQFEREVCTVLDKVCPDKVKIVADHLTSIEAQNLGELQILAAVIFAKAVARPQFSEEYAKVLAALRTSYPKFPAQEEGGKVQTLMHEVLNICQAEFELVTAHLGAPGKREKISQAGLSPDLKRRQEEILAIVMFIGHLFKCKLTSVKVIGQILQDLIVVGKRLLDEHIVWCVCTLVDIIGHTLDTMTDGRTLMSQIMRQLEVLGGTSLSGDSYRTRKFIHGLVVLRRCQWNKSHFPSYQNIALQVYQLGSRADQPAIGFAHPKTEVVFGTMKMDGSLVVAFKWQGELLVTTRSRMDSWQAKWALAWLRDSRNCDMSAIKAGWTYMFEAVYQDNRVIIPYAFDALVLISATNPAGYFSSHAEMTSIAEMLGVPVVPVTKARVHDFEQVTNQLDGNDLACLGAEGWVLRRGATLSKVVAPAYKLAASDSTRAQIHPLAIWNAARKNSLDVFLKHLGVQPHFECEARAMYSALRRSFYDLRDALCDPTVRLGALLAAVVAVEGRRHVNSSDEQAEKTSSPQQSLHSDLRHLLFEVLPALNVESRTQSLAVFARARISCRLDVDLLARALLDMAKEGTTEQRVDIARAAADLCHACPQYADHCLLAALAHVCRSHLLELSEQVFIGTWHVDALLAVIGELCFRHGKQARRELLPEVAKDLLKLSADFEQETCSSMIWGGNSFRQRLASWIESEDLVDSDEESAQDTAGHDNDYGMGCTRCGCSCMFDPEGERVCWCDACHVEGCTYNSALRSSASKQHDERRGLRTVLTEFVKAVMPQPDQSIFEGLDQQRLESSEHSAVLEAISIQLSEHARTNPRLARLIQHELGIPRTSLDKAILANEANGDTDATSYIDYYFGEMKMESSVLASALMEQLFAMFGSPDNECLSAWQAISEAVVNAGELLQDELAVAEPDASSRFRVGIFDCFRPRKGTEIRGYTPSIVCRQTWAKGWPSFDARSLGLEVQPFLQGAALVGVFSMLDFSVLARSCSVSIWWRRVVRRHFFKEIHSSRRSSYISRRRAARYSDDDISLYTDSETGIHRHFHDYSDEDSDYGYGYFSRSRAGSY